MKARIFRGQDDGVVVLHTGTATDTHHAVSFLGLLGRLEQRTLLALVAGATLDLAYNLEDCKRDDSEVCGDI